VDELQKDIAVEKAVWLAEQQRKQHAKAAVPLPGTPCPISPAVSPPGSPMASDRDSLQRSVASSASAVAAAAAAEWKEPRIGEWLGRHAWVTL
jgi:hypothetical protein